MTVSKIIPFISQISAQEQLLWLEQLKIHLPDETIAPISDLSSQQLQLCEIAIVANPDPKELALLPNLVWLQSLWAGVDSLVSHFSQSQFNQAKFNLARLIDPRLADTMAEAVLTWVLYFHQVNSC